MQQLITKKKVNPMTMMKTFPMLAIEQWERLILSHNVEFRGGFYVQAQGIDGNVREIYVPDTREVFCNTCEALAILILPASKTEFKTKYKEIKEEAEELTKEFIDKTEAEESIVLGEAYYTKQEDKILLEEYNNTKVQIYQGLFYALSKEFYRHKYWKSTSIQD